MLLFYFWPVPSASISDHLRKKDYDSPNVKIVQEGRCLLCISIPAATSVREINM